MGHTVGALLPRLDALGSVRPVSSLPASGVITLGAKRNARAVTPKTSHEHVAVFAGFHPVPDLVPWGAYPCHGAFNPGIVVAHEGPLRFSRVRG